MTDAPALVILGCDGVVVKTERLANFKVPVHWRFTDRSLPRNATGKVVRREVEV